MVDVQFGAGQAVEARDLAEHPQIGAAGQGPRLREDPAQPFGTGVFESTAVTADRHRHVRVLRAHAQLAEQTLQGRVGAVVVHDEAGIHAEPLPGAVGAGIHPMGVGMAAEASIRFVEHDFTGAGQHPGRGEAG